MVHLKAHKQLVSDPLAGCNFFILLDSPYWRRGLLHSVLADGSCHSPTHLAIVMASKMLLRERPFYIYIIFWFKWQVTETDRLLNHHFAWRLETCCALWKNLLANLHSPSGRPELCSNNGATYIFGIDPERDGCSWLYKNIVYGLHVQCFKP